MRVFLSWSGELSEQIAQIYRTWIPSVLQAAKPYFSPKDIEKGKRWSSEIEKELHSSSICLIFLTKENINSSWIMFEAGAVSKSIGPSHVCPILFDLDPTDITGPLSQFQATKFDKNESKRLFLMMNEAAGDHKLNDEVANAVFEKWWPDLYSQISSAVDNFKQKNGKKEEIRTDRELIEEILLLTRNINSNKESQISARTATFVSATSVPYEETGYKKIIMSIKDIVTRITLIESDFDELEQIFPKLRNEISHAKSISAINKRSILNEISEIEKTLQSMRNNSSVEDDDIPF